MLSCELSRKRLFARLLMGWRQEEDKINKAFVKQTMPLFEIWSNACDLNEVEREILRMKLFDESKPTEEEILDALKERYNYYYSDRQFRKHWRRIRKKIDSLIP